VFLLSRDGPDAFDSRYFGVTRSSDLVGNAQLLWPFWKRPLLPLSSSACCRGRRAAVAADSGEIVAASARFGLHRVYPAREVR
jgi:hypothetical protein